jgi:hypothetical protein
MTHDHKHAAPPELGAARNRAFSLIELLVLIATLAVMVLAAGFVPVHRSGCRCVRLNCVNNLKQVGLSFRLWSGDHNDLFPMQLAGSGQPDAPAHAIPTNGVTAYPYAWEIFQVMSNELSSPKIVTCPLDKNRAPAANFATGFGSSNVGYFVGVDADETHPTRILSGDQYISNGQKNGGDILEMTAFQSVGWAKQIHEGKGVILLADGSVQEYNAVALKTLLTKTGLSTNRLAMP